jgi:hypothetical protein
MERATTNLEVIEENASVCEQQMTELQDLQLSLIGGGIGDAIR